MTPLRRTSPAFETSCPRAASPGPKLFLRTLRGVFVLTMLLLPAAARAQEPPKLQWELVNPFRFIRDQKTVDELRTIYDDLPQKSAATLQRTLQDRADAEVDETRKEAAKKYDCAHTKSEEEKRQCFAPYRGWFARLAVKDHVDTCWNSDTHEYRREGACKDYIYPESHRVRVWIKNPEALGDAAPMWKIEPGLRHDDCDHRYHLKFCVEFDVRYQPDNPAKIRVFAQFPTLTLTTDPDGIQVRDKLIVGLGDSYAAGEGNPDIPAEFIDGDRDTDFFFTSLAGNGTNRYPKKDKDNQAVWLDRRCHRSMYSYQFQTALQLALRNPREAITYVTFSCSGAVTDQIASKSQKAKEAGRDLIPQLEALRKVLRNGSKPTREIDYLLLSTGGNDVGFANYVGYILLRQPWLLKALSVLKKVSAERMKENFDGKKFERDLLGDADHIGNYANLQKALLDPPPALKPEWIRIKDCKAGQPCPRILLTPYPDALTDETGKPCDGNRGEFVDAFGDDDKRAAKIETVRKYVFEQIKTVQAQAGSRFGWTLISDNPALYVKHGFCAHIPDSPSIGEKFRIPKWDKDEERWTEFDPREYRAYWPRARWFRLPVDAKLTTDQRHKVLFITLDIALEDVISNIMHPTAEGLATTADLNVNKILELEGRPR